MALQKTGKLVLCGSPRRLRREYPPRSNVGVSQNYGYFESPCFWELPRKSLKNENGAWGITTIKEEEEEEEQEEEEEEE